MERFVPPHCPAILWRQNKYVSTLRELVQEVLERSSEEVTRAVAEEASQRDSPIVETLEVVKHVHGTIWSELEDRSQVLVASELCSAVDVSCCIGYEATVRICCFGLRKAVDYGVTAVFGDFVDGSIFCDSAFHRRTKQVSGRIEQQAALWNCAVGTSSKGMEHGEGKIASDLEDDAAPCPLVFEGFRTRVVSPGLGDAIQISCRILHQRSDRICSICSTGKFVEKMHVASRIQGKDAAAADLARLVIPELRRSENDSVLA